MYWSAALAVPARVSTALGGPKVGDMRQTSTADEAFRSVAAVAEVRLEEQNDPATPSLGEEQPASVGARARRRDSDAVRRLDDQHTCHNSQAGGGGRGLQREHYMGATKNSCTVRGA